MNGMHGMRRWRRLAGRAYGDEAGASLVQFIVVLPVFALIVVGTWSLFQVYSAQQTLCEAVYASARYLQVEGPMLDEAIYPYPTGWEDLAIGIINTELKSNAVTKIGPLVQGDVDISPDFARFPPQESIEVTADNVNNSWFFVRATTVVTNPLAVLVPGTGPGGALRLACQKTSFYEGPPIGPTNEQGGNCRPPNRECTPMPGGEPTWTPTACPDGRDCCPVCRYDP
jgi:hypothetical protein